MFNTTFSIFLSQNFGVIHPQSAFGTYFEIKFQVWERGGVSDHKNFDEIHENPVAKVKGIFHCSKGTAETVN